MANKYCNLDGSKKIKLDYTNINNGFAEVEADRATHISGAGDKHAAQHITYSGDQTGADVKTAIDNCKKDINNISMTGSEHDALVTAALVDEEGTDFGAGGTGTGLEGRLSKWEQKHIAHLADIAIINLRNFGFVDDETTDNGDAIINAIKSAFPYKDNMTEAEIIALNKLPARRIILSHPVRTTKTIYIPSGLTIDGIGQGYFPITGSKVGAVIRYENADKHTCAVSGLFYKKNVGGTYDICTNIDEQPTGIQFDNKTYLTCFNSAFLNNVTIQTDCDLGLRWIGGTGSITENVTIGSNVYAEAPKCAMILGDSWGSPHKNLRMLYRSQGLYAFGANGGAIFYNPYINRAGGTVGQETETLQYTTGYEPAGSYGILLNQTIVSFIDPIVEHAYISIGTYKGTFCGNNVHCEAKAKYTFWLNDGNLSVHNLLNANNTTGYTGASLIFLEGCSNYNNITFSGSFPKDGYNLIESNNSATAAVRFLNNPKNYFEYGTVKAGYWKHIAFVSPITVYDSVYVSSTGDDAKNGFRSDTAVATLTKAIEIASTPGLGIKYIRLLTNITLTADIDISNIQGMVQFTGQSGAKTISMGGYKIVTVSGASRKSLEFNSIVLSAATTATDDIFYIQGDGLDVKLLNSTVSCRYIIQVNGGRGISQVSIMADGYSTLSTVTKYIYCVGAVTVYSLVINTVTRNTAIDASPTIVGGSSFVSKQLEYFRAV